MRFVPAFALMGLLAACLACGSGSDGFQQGEPRGDAADAGPVADGAVSDAPLADGDASPPGDQAGPDADDVDAGELDGPGDVASDGPGDVVSDTASEGVADGSGGASSDGFEETPEVLPEAEDGFEEPELPVCEPEPDPPDDGFEDTNCDGIDGDAVVAVFVAAPVDGGDDLNPGTMEAPMATLQKAMDKASWVAGKSAVYVSEGVYKGTIRLNSGVSVHGGYSAADGWIRSESHVATVLVDESDALGDRIGVVAEDIVDATLVERLTIHVALNASPSGNNTGVLLRAADALELRWIEVLMGGGGSGTPAQTPGANALLVGSNGGAGAPGCINDSIFCSSCVEPAAGAAGAATSCGVGGPAGLGGEGGATGWGIDEAGSPGAAGADGQDAAGGGDFGWFLDGRYQPADGGVAGGPTDGIAGSGGGGGGGGGGHDLNFMDCDAYGGSGGGGGGGGCPGGHGSSGGGGGAVFGMLFLDTAPVVHYVFVRNAPGGTGGAATAGGGGSPGGGGALGGQGFVGNSERSGDGGAGGAGGGGGRGGHGGGGGGGPSYCFFFANLAGPPDTSQLSDYSCTDFAGGAGGASAGHAGATGDSGEVGTCGEACFVAP
jgi:hypothetical protein